MKINIQLIKLLQKKTGVGPVYCKKALEASDCDLDKAEAYLQEQGIEALNKRSENQSEETRVFTKHTKKRAFIIAISCETDFVAESELLINAAHEICQLAFDSNMNRSELDSVLREKTYSLKERIVLKDYKLITTTADEQLYIYTHFNKKLVSVVKLTGGTQELGQTCAIHAAAVQPRFLSKDLIPQEYIDSKVKEYKTHFVNLGKPEQLAETIAQRKTVKEIEEHSLLNQTCALDDSHTVQELLDMENGRITDFFICPQ